MTACHRTGALVRSAMKSPDCTLSVAAWPLPTEVPCVALPDALTFSVPPLSSPPPPHAQSIAASAQLAIQFIPFMISPDVFFSFVGLGYLIDSQGRGILDSSDVRDAPNRRGA
jgi:hypothetical protein